MRGLARRSSSCGTGRISPARSKTGITSHALSMLPVVACSRILSPPPAASLSSPWSAHSVVEGMAEAMPCCPTRNLTSSPGSDRGFRSCRRRMRAAAALVPRDLGGCCGRVRHPDACGIIGACRRAASERRDYDGHARAFSLSLSSRALLRLVYLGAKRSSDRLWSRGVFTAG